MNLNQVSTYIQEPHLLGAEQIPELKQLCDDFPYTAIYPLLYLTALSNVKSAALEEALMLYAYRLSDRTRLYNLVSQTTASSKSFREQEESTEIDTTGADIPIPEIEPEEPKIISLSIEEEITTNHREEVHTEEKPVENAPEFEYFTTASSVGQDYFSKAETSENAPEYIQTPEDKEEVTEPNISPSEEASDSHSSRSFLDWIKSNGQNPSEQEPVREPQLSKKEIIDRFIETQPTITRQKAEFFSPPKKAKESLNEEAMPVSETLAKIFTAQGNYPKAIHVYHQLMLANPEKKTFFAVQIEELKKKLTI